MALVKRLRSLAKRPRKNVKVFAKSCTASDVPKVVSMIFELSVVRRLGSRGTREWVADSLVNPAGP
jgi:hypothetical protein